MRKWEEERKKVFLKIAERYKGRCEHPSSISGRIEEKEIEIFSSLIPSGARNVLDVGSGRCDLGRIIKVKEIVAFDYLLPMLSLAPPFIKKVVGDARLLPFKDEAFEVVVAKGLLVLFSLEEKNKILSELFRVSSKMVIVDIIDKTSPLYYIMNIYRTIRGRRIRIWGTSLRELKIKEGWRIKKVVSLSVFRYFHLIRMIVFERDET